jgi:hypothetical protein
VIEGQIGKKRVRDCDIRMRTTVRFYFQQSCVTGSTNVTLVTLAGHSEDCGIELGKRVM